MVQYLSPKPPNERQNGDDDDGTDDGIPLLYHSSACRTASFVRNFDQKWENGRRITSAGGGFEPADCKGERETRSETMR